MKTWYKYQLNTERLHLMIIIPKLTKHIINKIYN